MKKKPVENLLHFFFVITWQFNDFITFKPTYVINDFYSCFPFLKILFYILVWLCTCMNTCHNMCVCMCVCVCVCVCLVVERQFGGSQFSYFTMWVTGIKIRSSIIRLGSKLPLSVESLCWSLFVTPLYAAVYDRIKWSSFFNLSKELFWKITSYSS